MNLRTVALSGLILAALATPAAARPGWYAGLGAGWSMPSDIDITINGGPTSGSLQLKSAPKFLFTGGYGWNWGLRTELELSHANYALVSITGPKPPPSPISGSSSINAAMINALYDYPLLDNVALTVGAGIGMSRVGLTIKGPPDASSTDNAIAWQAIAGVTWQVADNFELQADYRYFSAGATDQTIVPGTTVNQKGNKNQSVMLTARWYPWAEEAVAYEPAPAPLGPARAAPAAVRTFIVFFDFDRSNLTADARRVIGEAVRVANDAGVVRVLVTGHTDTVGSRNYNQGLSERRAASVKSEMIRLGLRGGDIATIGKNFSQPLVDTGPNMREPQNRRAVIDLGA